MNPYLKTYKENSILTASPEQILLMLYDGAISFLNRAKIHMQEKDNEQTNFCIIKAERIIAEFMNTLNFDVGGELANNLYSLYNYLYNRLIEANIKKDSEILDEVLNHLQNLRTTWDEAIKINNKQLSEENNELNQKFLA